MSFLQEIEGFSKYNLKPTATEVTTTGGEKLLESRDSSGRVTVTRTGLLTLGFVGDYQPDLQVGDVLPGLLISSQDVAADLELLRQYKVTHILNLASQCSTHFYQHFTYKSLDILDLPTQSLNPFIPGCLAFIKTAIDGGGCVLVHCNAGVSRSAAIVIAYVMCTLKLDFVEAYSLVKSKRPSIRPNDGFIAELKSLQESLLHKKNSDG